MPVGLQVAGDLVHRRRQAGQGAPQRLGLDLGEGPGSADSSARARRTGSMAPASRPSVAGSRAPSTTPSMGRSRPPGPAVPRPASSKRRQASDSTARWSASRRGSRLTTTSSGTPGLGLAQELPGHVVGVALGGGDEQAQVGRLEQLLGGAAVLGLDRVDVGRVDQGDPGEGAVVDDQLEAVGVGQGGQHLAAHEGVDLAGASTTTGRMVVGRTTPLGLTAAPASPLSSDDFPAPVDPSRMQTSGASRSRTRGSR